MSGWNIWVWCSNADGYCGAHGPGFFHAAVIDVRWLLLSGVVLIGVAVRARIETQYLCEEGLSRGDGAMVFDVKGRFFSAAGFTG